jgi:hypothetical protein
VKSNASSFPCRDPWQSRAGLELGQGMGKARPPRATAWQGRARAGGGGARAGRGV